jgi:hypothetical protein
VTLFLPLKDGVEQQEVVLEDGDLFVPGPRTNARPKHAVMLMMNDRVIKQWRSCKPRISVICFLRYSKTQLWRAQVYIYITSLHAFERKSCCRIVVAAANSCNYQYASFSTLSSHTCPHCSLSKCSVSQVVSVYAGYCCCSLRSLYINRNTEG